MTGHYFQGKCWRMPKKTDTNVGRALRGVSAGTATTGLSRPMNSQPHTASGTRENPGRVSPALASRQLQKYFVSIDC